MFSVVSYLVLVIVTAFFLFYASWIIWTWRYFFLPQPLALPWIGCALSIPTDDSAFFQFVRKYAVKCNHLYCVWLGFTPFIMTSRVEYVQAILNSNSLLKKSSLYTFVERWLSTGLLTSYGTKWKTRRRMITPSFHFGILMDFVDIFEEQAKKLCFKLRDVADTGESIDIQIPVSLAKLDVICETSMGVKINAQDGSTSKYVEGIKDINSLISERQKNPFYWYDFFYKFTSSGKVFFKTLDFLHNFTINVINKSIERRKQERINSVQENEPKKKRVFLDILLDSYDRGEINVEGIREEVDTFMFEGHDTTSVGLAWTLYELGRYPEIQSKLYEEIKNADCDLPIVDRVKSIKYLDYVLKEGLRLHPPVPVYARLIEQDTIIENNVFPKGTQIAISTIDLHRNPMYWHDPDVFDPERFTEERVAKRNPYCYVPFSAGARNCIGQKFAVLEEKIFLYYLMSMYEVKSVQDYSQVKSGMAIVHKSENGLFLEFLTR